MQKNAFFQLVNNPDGLYLTLHPPDAGGKEISKFDIIQYLKSAGAPAMSDELLNTALRDHVSVETVFLSENTVSAIDESVIITISDDKMSVFIRFIPATNNGKPITKGAILQKLSEHKVNFGIIEENIDEWLNNKIYCTDFLVAQGKEPEESFDAKVEFKFVLDKKYKPAVTEEGNIDFRQLNLLNHVARDDVLAVLTPEIQGEPGANVLGVPISARKAVKKTLKTGKNVILSEDGLTARAECYGHVTIEADKLVVHNVYTISGDVGPNTGNVDFDGTVTVSGDVLSGYSITATDDIVIQGVVESTNLTAGGNIIVANGIHGGAKAVVTAEKNVTVKFIQESVVKAGGSVYAGSVIYSTVAARDSVYVTSEKGLVRGSEVRARSLIAVKNVGTAFSGGNSQLEVGSDPDDTENYTKLRDMLAEQRLKQTKAQQAFAFFRKKLESGNRLTPEQEVQLQMVKVMMKELDGEISRLFEEFNTLKEDMAKSEKGEIRVEGTIFSGAKIIISNVSLYVQNDLVRSKFIKRNMSIDIVAL